MRKIAMLAMSGLILGAGGVQAHDNRDTPRVYAYPGVNLCPAGLRPVTIDGVISCGRPNQGGSYGAMKATPPRRR